MSWLLWWILTAAGIQQVGRRKELDRTDLWSMRSNTFRRRLWKHLRVYSVAGLTDAGVRNRWALLIWLFD